MNPLRQIPSLSIWLVGVFASLIGIMGAFDPIFALTAGVLTAIVITIQFINQGNTIVQFQVSDWNRVNDSYEFKIDRQHGKGRKPNITVYIPTSNGSFEEVGCDVKTHESGEILIGASQPFEGEVRIS